MNEDEFEPRIELDEELTVRPAEYADIDDILVVENLSQPAPWTRRVFEKEFDLEFSRTWVVESRASEHPRIVAFLTFWIVHDELHILNVCVHPVARRRGLARRLLTELETLGVRQKASLMSLEVRTSNERAKALYASMGFIPIGSRPHYYADNGEDADILVLILEG